MNRTTVVVIALAILLAHTLAIHQTPSGNFAAPYERAHVAFRLGRHLVYEGRAVWDSQSPFWDTYPSLTWIGLAFTLGLARFLATRLDAILFELSPNDPVTLIAVSALLALTAIVACIVPARRATRVDPMVALRYE